jgi:hypothetical protein
MSTDECVKYDEIIEWGIATANEINLVRCICNGSWNSILDSIVYVRTGFQTWESYKENEMEEGA